MKNIFIIPLILVVLVVAGCESSDGDARGQGGKGDEWRLIASSSYSFEHRGLDTNDYLHRFDYTSDGMPRRLWYYDIQPDVYDEAYLSGSNVYSDNFGGGESSLIVMGILLLKVGGFLQVGLLSILLVKIIIGILVENHRRVILHLLLTSR